jgi:hypothetical protein
MEIKKEKDTATGWQFLVYLSEKDKYEVILDKKYWERLTKEKILPEELIKKSFEFLLEREPKEAILKSFNLKVIQTYFPEYEEKMSL